MEEKVLFLKNTKIFASLDEESLASVAELMKERVFNHDEIMIERYSAGTSMYLIVSGGANIFYIKAEQEDIQLGTLMPGQHFGEMSLFDNKPRSAMVKSVGETKTLIIEKEDLFALIDSKPALGVRILTALVQELCVRLRDTSAALYMSMYFGDNILNQNDIDRFGEFYSDVINSEKNASKH